MIEPLITFALTSAFWAWVLFAGGAEWLEGRFASGVLVYWRAPEWPAEGIKLFAWCMWVLAVGWLIVESLAYK